ncbi:mucin-17-like [Chiloscyllium plagiosum]|uniref:mucin-17-like n=1 Tax=Chiloscyllium plagiosum TaxID=36176 RepID=UPI001CB7C142|nr:mucin-17-like [Chiloscyllium plagiosum]
MNPASQFEMPPRPLQASISIKETMGAPEILFREFHNRMVTQRKALTGSSYKKKLPFLLKTGSPAHWYKAFNSRDLLLTAIPNPVGTLLVSTPTTVGASTRPGDNLLLSTPPSETLPVSTPPTGSLLLSTPPADTLPVSTPPADILPVSTHSAKTLTVSIPPVETLPVSTPPTDSLPVSTSPAEILPVSTPHTEILPVSTPPADSLPVSIPSADTLPVSTTHAETLPVSTPPTDSLPVSTPPAEILPVSTPRADSLPVSTLAGDTLPMSTLPVDTLSVSIPFAETLPVSIPPTDTLPVSIPTAEALPVSSPPTDDLTVSTPPADSLPVSTPPAEILPVSTPLTFVLPVSTPAETLHMSTFPAEALPVSNPPTGDLPVSTPPTDSLPVSTPPAETLPVSTPLAETLPVSILSAESLPGSTLSVETLPVSTSPTDTLPVSNPSTDILPTAILPNETVLASTSSPKILLASFSFVANSAATIQSIISPFTLTTRNNPVTINPLYNVPLISPTQSVLPDNLPVELFCDFEHGLCDWEQSTTDDFDWVLHRYQTFSRETGPKRDHTKGQCKRQGGHYLYLKGSYSQLSGEQAALISPPLREQKCLTFWYNMFGKHMGSLNVFLKYEHTTSWHKLWSVSGNQGRKWLNAEIDIFTNGDKFRVIIEGVLGPSYQSDAAIDDVQIYRNNCDSSWKHWNPTCNRGLKKRNKSHLG